MTRSSAIRLASAPPSGNGALRRAVAEPQIEIRVSGLEVGFDQRLVMNGLDLDLYRGEVLGFVGASGAGKSVLTRAILGLIPKRAGVIEVETVSDSCRPCARFERAFPNEDIRAATGFIRG